MKIKVVIQREDGETVQDLAAAMSSVTGTLASNPAFEFAKPPRVKKRKAKLKGKIVRT